MSDPWTVTMREPFTLDEYCLVARESVTYKVILDQNSSWAEVLNAYVLDFHHKTTVLHPDVLPWLYVIFVIILLFGLFGFTVAALKQAEKLIKGWVDYRLKSKEAIRPVIQNERRSRHENSNIEDNSIQQTDNR